MSGFTRASECHRHLVDRFNGRLRSGGREEKFTLEPKRFANFDGSGQDEIDVEKFILIDKSGEMRAAYNLKHQLFQLGDEVVDVGNIGMPISEGIVDRKYSFLSLAILSDCLRRSPKTYGLGGDGLRGTVMTLFRRRRWDLYVVPFYFRVFHPYRFCRRIRFLRSTMPLRIAMDALAFSGLGWATLKLAHAIRTVRPEPRKLSVRLANEFDVWADDIWNEARASYPFAAVRTHPYLNFLHRGEVYRRIIVEDGDRPIGWAVCLLTEFDAHKQFGSLRVGSIIDVLSFPGLEVHVVEAATRYLQKHNADLVISNQLHRNWQGAFRATGYLQGPSNYVLARSPALKKHCDVLGIKASDIHMTRADGDGPIHL